METSSIVEIRTRQVCGRVLPADFDRAMFTVDGREPAPDVTANYRQRVRILYESTLNREVCTAYLPDGDGLVTSITVDTVPQPSARLRVIWVSPSDGYRVAR